MKREEFEHQVAPEAGTLGEMIDVYDDAQDLFFRSVALWWSNSLEKRTVDTLNKSIHTLSDEFENLATYVFDDPANDNQERANVLATVILCSDSMRVDRFRELSPESDFKSIREDYEEHVCEPDQVHNAIALAIEESLDLEDIDEDDYKTHLVQEYVGHILCDTKILTRALRLSED